ncbi:MAG: glycosyltransferase family 4 protein [Butyrivibrio sp.]|nr:glycosyltransferase family 4 protein [Butyrivibrio sp.]
MKVLFISHHTDLYGANRSLIELAEDMIKRYGVEVHIICPNKGRFYTEAVAIGAHVRCFNYFTWQSRRFFLLKYVLRVLMNPLLLKRINRYVASISPDIIHSNSSVTDLGAVLAQKNRLPFVWHIREFGKEHYKFRYLIKQTSVKNYYEKADRIIAVSDELKENYLGKYPNLYITTIYDGVKPITVKWEKHKTINFCIVGNICDNKGQLDVLKALSILIGKGKKDISLHIIGDGEKKYIRKVDKYIKEKKLEKYTVLHGYSNNIADVLRNMDVGIMASKYEAFGRVTVEYMYAGLGVIASYEGGTKEIVGKRALLYKPGDIDKLAALMEYCIENKQLVRECGQKMRLEAEMRFNQLINTDKIMRIYADLGVK